MSQGPPRLAAEDPSFGVETIFESVPDRSLKAWRSFSPRNPRRPLQREFKSSSQHRARPRLAYRETISTKAEVHLPHQEPVPAARCSSARVKFG